MSPENQIRALIVDDQPTIVNLLKTLMESIGVTPILASDGMMALEKFFEEKPHIVFTDILMPRMNGIVLLRKIKALNPDMPVIVFTGYAHYRELIQNEHYKPDNFLAKPLDVKQIIEIMLGSFPSLRR